MHDTYKYIVSCQTKEQSLDVVSRWVSEGASLSKSWIRTPEEYCSGFGQRQVLCLFHRGWDSADKPEMIDHIGPTSYKEYYKGRRECEFEGSYKDYLKFIAQNEVELDFSEDIL